jgi:hypothetical protein
MGRAMQIGMKRFSKFVFSLFIFSLVVFSSLPGREVNPVDGEVEVIVRPDTLKTKLSGLIRLGFGQLDRDDPLLARRTFNKALSLDTENMRCHLGLGRSYLELKPRKLGLLESIGRLFGRDYTSRAISSLNRALELDPDNWEVHYWLGSSYTMKYGRDDLERALKHLQRAYELAGDTLQVRLKLAMLHKALGDFGHAEQILFDINSSSSGEMDPLACLELVKIYAKRKDFRAVEFYYRKGVESITTREELDAYCRDLAIIASKREREDFLTLAQDSAVKYFQGFWVKRDHRMGMEPGMRLAYHYQRLSVADSLYSVPFFNRNPSINPKVAYVPEEGVAYDDRGVVYVLHGPPDRTLSYLDGEVEPNETWIYYRKPDDLILNFVALGGNQDYQLVYTLDAAVRGGGNFDVDSDGNFLPRNSQEGLRAEQIRQLYDSRTEVGRGLYFRLSNRPGDMFARMEEYENNYLDINEALNTESTRSGNRRNLESFYDMVDFRGSGDGKSVLEFYAGVPGRHVIYNRSTEGFNYDIAYQLRVYDSLWRKVGHFDRVESFESLINPHDLVDRPVVGLGKVKLKPGNYYYFVKIQNGEATSLYNGEMQVDSYEGDSLKTSEIIAADKIFTAVADSGKFNRYDLQVHPNPSRIFHPSEKMFAYQEIYNLRLGVDGTVNYRATYALTRIKKDRNVLGRIADSFRWLFGSGDKGEQVVLTAEKNRTPIKDDLVADDVAIDLSANTDGLYELSIQVEDLNNNGRMFRRNTRFKVKK